MMKSKKKRLIMFILIKKNSYWIVDHVSRQLSCLIQKKHFLWEKFRSFSHITYSHFRLTTFFKIPHVRVQSEKA